MRIALGTVQFGLDYGISNYAGKVPNDEITKILNLAKLNNISYLDTAMGYGISESVIGKYRKRHNDNHFNITTKLPDISASCNSISEFLNESLSRLSCSQVYSLLCHVPENLNLHTFEELFHLKEQRKIKKIGVSVYSPEQAFSIADNFHIDLIQFPLNIFDQRFIESGCLANLKDKGIEIHTRSLFLQGLLLQPIKEINDYFRPYLSKVTAFHELCLQHNLSALDMALSFTHSIKDVDKFVIGVCSEKQLREILKSYKKTADINIESQILSSTEEDFINPSLWNIK